MREFKDPYEVCRSCTKVPDEQKVFFKYEGQAGSCIINGCQTSFLCFWKRAFFIYPTFTNHTVHKIREELIKTWCDVLHGHRTPSDSAWNLLKWVLDLPYTRKTDVQFPDVNRTMGIGMIAGPVPPCRPCRYGKSEQDASAIVVYVEGELFTQTHVGCPDVGCAFSAGGEGKNGVTPQPTAVRHVWHAFHRYVENPYEVSLTFEDFFLLATVQSSVQVEKGI